MSSSRRTRIDETRLPWSPFCLALILSVGCGHDEAHPQEEDEHAHEAEGEAVHGGDDQHEEHEEGHVVLSPEQFANAGIEVQEAGPGEFSAALVLAATVVPDADAVTHVNPKVPGLVREIRVGLGNHVEAGDVLCVIDSVELGEAVSNYVQSRAMLDSANEGLEREVALFEARIEATESLLDAAIQANIRILEQERKLREQELSTLRPLLEAEMELERARLEKIRKLVELRAERDSRQILLERQVRESQIALQAARNRLQALGVDPSQPELLEEGSTLAAGTYELRAARAGIVLRRHITVGESVDRETKLFVLEDLSHVWLLGSAFESQLASIRTGSPAEVRLDAFPGRMFTGRVDLVGYEVDPTSRSLPIRIELENPTLESWGEPYPIRPGMFGRVDVEVERRAARVMIPESALVHEDEGDFVFVQEEPLEFERRAVDAIEGVGGVCEVRSGLDPGELVVVSGTFLLKSAARSEELGGGHSH